SAGDGNDAGRERTGNQQSGAEAAIDAPLFQFGNRRRAGVGPPPGVSADQQSTSEIRSEIYRRRTGGRDRLLHLQSEAEGAGPRPCVFGRTGVGGYEISGSGEDVWEMGQRVGGGTVGDTAIHAV